MCILCSDTDEPWISGLVSSQTSDNFGGFHSQPTILHSIQSYYLHYHEVLVTRVSPVIPDEDFDEQSGLISIEKYMFHAGFQPLEAADMEG